MFILICDNYKRFIRMKLNKHALKMLSEAGKVLLPTQNEISASIAHFGIGGFHRAHQALYTQQTMEQTGDSTWGVIGVGIMPFDAKISQVLKQQDYMYTLIEKYTNGHKVYRLVNSIVEHILAADCLQHCLQKLARPELKIISLTITEGGYFMDKSTGKLESTNADILHDLQQFSHNIPPKTIFGYLAKVLKRRKDLGNEGITILSCDNIQHNGRLTKTALMQFLTLLGDKQLLQWIQQKCTFPNSMVDRITPQIAREEIQQLESEVGIKDEWPVSCQYFKQWIIEDQFANGRPKWEVAGVQFVENVSPYEKMKLRVLNGAHQALCYLGSLHGYSYVHEAAQDEVIRLFVLKYLKEEVVGTLDRVPGIDLEEYQKTVMERFGNPHVKDSLSRICEFTSDRVPLFNLPSVRDMIKTHKQSHLPLSAMIISSWIKYAQGIDQNSNKLPDLVDNRKQQIIKVAMEVQKLGDVSQFLAIEGIFEEERQDQTFSRLVQGGYDSLKKQQVKQALRELW